MRMAGSARLGRFACITAMGSSAGAACSDTAPPRAQLLIVIDTDAHVVGEIASRPEVSPDATIDTLEIEVLDDQNRFVDENTFLVADTSNWPLSFGIEPSAELGTEVRIWIHAFRALFASSGTTGNGTATLASPPQVTIDRLIAVPLPSSGVSQVRVTLRYDCLGTPSSFGSPLQTCLSKALPKGDPHDGLDAADASLSSSVGTWPPAIEVPCKSTPSATQVCVPGGFFVLGDLGAVGAGLTTDYEPVPLRPVILSPFLIDKYEFTVGRFRALVNEGVFSGTMVNANAPSDPTNQYCTWLGSSDGANDALPLNCVPYDSAVALCDGLLPTEAEWEYAARGRGERYDYPWGDAEPQCCSASLDRSGPPLYPGTCTGIGIEPVGSHAISAQCVGTDASGATEAMGDVTRDGIYDMAGSLSEALADSLQSLSAPCWNTSAILTDPLCTAANAAPAMRGAYWNAGLASALLPLRYNAATDGSPTEGFRCAYKDGAP